MALPDFFFFNFRRNGFRIRNRNDVIKNIGKFLGITFTKKILVFRNSEYS